MKRSAEVTVFAGLAALIHVSLFATAPQSGVQSSGAGGEAMVSLTAANATVTEMVEAWERPPRPPATSADLVTPDTPPEAPEMPEFQLAEAPQVAVQMALPQPGSATVIQVDLSTPPPPPEPELAPPPEPEQRPKPRPKPAPTPPPKQTEAAISDQTVEYRAAQRAAGAGGGAQSGVSGSSETATLSAGRQAKLRAVWGAKIRSRIERRKRYPSDGRGDGRVVVQITVAASGALVNVRVVKSSGSAAFDRAALKAVSRAGKFPKMPKQLGGGHAKFSLPISFSK
ncbi:energy transducer TonB [Pseudophaeobacter profundi]|uniref:energy transducer TonB n=1 Tax=Pseudophaeobacter profundi TaxID=3034152 RepID=UPI00242D0CED|nr:energy transducer TonB [Pseudophaeobacter profundi]